MKFTAEELRNNILFTENTEKYYPIKGKRYYISQNGSDNNDGLSPESALQSPEAIENITLNPGDAVLFERGSLFRLKKTILLETGITYGSYGEGEKPKIYASPADYAKETWSKTDEENVWQASFKYMPAVGIVFNGGKDFGTLRHGTIVSKTPAGRWYFDGDVTLTENGEFRHDFNNGIIYLYCDKGNPSDIYDSIEIISDVTAISRKYEGMENIVIDNLCLKYAGFGISLSYTKGNITISNCEIAYIGGRYISNCRVRYGNAIEFWEGYHNITVHNNWIYQIYDSAITWQGRSEGLCDNIIFTQNLLEYNNCDIEFFERPGAVLKNFKMDDNIMRFTNGGWGNRPADCRVRSEIEGCVRGLLERITTVEDMSFCGNVMYSPMRRIINLPMKEGQRENIKCENNILYFSPSHRLSDEVIRVEFDKPISSSNHEELEKAVSLFDDSMDIKYID